MKAIDIINFINEDRFSKYTYRQIVDELGIEDFLDYLETVCIKIIRNLKSETNLLKDAEVYKYPSINKIIFNGRVRWFSETLSVGDASDPRQGVQLDSLQVGYSIAVSGRDPKRFTYFLNDETNIASVLTKEIYKLYNNPRAIEEREYGVKYLDASK